MSAPARARHPLSIPLVLAGLFSIGVAWLLVGEFGAWDYYRTPLADRGYLPMHRLLRPSGVVGISLGAAGLIAMLSTLPYYVRKRWRLLAKLGSTSHWLEVHIFFGIVGPVLITFHTAFKFSGIISVAYWLMVAVWSSGFVGRYLYVRIPRSIRGVELTRRDLEGEIAEAQEAILAAPLPERARAALDEFDRSMTPAPGKAPGIVDLFLGEMRVRLRLLTLRRHLHGSGADVEAIHTAVARRAEHASLSRRLAHLERTRHLFEMWHLFHRPLVVGMFLIVGIHVGIAVYLGYAQVLLGAP